MTAAIITIGDEILIGQIVDTNSAWMARELNLLGISVIEIRSISDSREHILQSLDSFRTKVDFVIISGGLGPTKDDITKQTLNEYFGGKMIENQDVLTNIQEIFHIRNLKVTDNNRLQATVPDNCEILMNPSGTAPGMWFEKDGTIYVSLPGVPYELKDIFHAQLLPRITKLINGPTIVHRTIMTQGLPESYLANLIADWEDQLPDSIKLAYLPRPGIVRLRLSGIGDNKEEINSTLQVEIDKLLKIIDKHVFSLSEEFPWEVINRLCSEAKVSICTAESCTGGSISRLITSVPGSSAYYKGSVISYDNSIKVKELGVPEQIIEKEGAVCKGVVEEMANGIRKKYNCDYSVSVSGVAGPTGGTKEKPVGTTWIAVSSERKTFSKKFIFGEHRGRNIERASMSALKMLIDIILEENSGIKRF